MLKVAIIGAGGRMGKRLVALSIEDKDVALTGAIEHATSPLIGKDAGEVSGTTKACVPIKSDISEILLTSDVLIDFTSAESSLSNLKKVAEAGKGIVIGSTGFTENQLKEVKELSKSARVVLSSNMSVGINLMVNLLKDMCKTLGDDFDVEIIEAHHRLKKDSPSGTAVLLGKAVAGYLGRDYEKDAVHERNGLIGERTRREIGMQVIRGGDVVGDHTVMFLGDGERLELTHKASSRDTFAKGAIRAAKWLKDKPFGLYDMQDVLGFKNQ